MTKIGVSSREADAFAEITQRLRHYRSMVANYQACKELYDQLYPSGTQVLTDMPKAPTVTYEVERWADRRLSQRERMERSLCEMRLAFEDLEKLVNSVTGDYNTVLTRRYMLNESWEIIGQKMNYCERQVRRLHERAIYKIMSNFVQTK